MAYRRSSRNKWRKYPPLSSFSPGATSHNERTASARSYVEQKFSNLSGHQWEQFARAYGRKHGSSAEGYFRKTYEKWKNGTTRMSVESHVRMLSIIPTILTESERQELLELTLPPPTALLPRLIKHQNCDLSSVNQVLGSIAANLTTTTISLDWFVKGVISDPEHHEIQEACRFMAASIFTTSVENLRSDLAFLIPGSRSFKGNAPSILYHSPSLNLTIKIPDRALPPFSVDPILSKQAPVPTAKSKLRPLIERYLAKFAAQQLIEIGVQGGSHGIAIHDLNVAIAKFNQTSEDHEVDSTIKVAGKGGYAEFSVSYVGINLLRSKKQHVTLWLFIQTTVALAGVVVCLSKPALFCPISIVVFVLLPVISNSWKELASINERLLTHPRALTRRP